MSSEQEAPMPSDPSFVAHVLDLVSLLGRVDARAMFGGHGLYAEGVMFGLLDDGELFLKTDEATRARFVEADCKQWRYVTGKVRMENTGYFRPPDAAHEDPEAMLAWARLGLDAALRARAAKAARKRRAPRASPGAASAKTVRPKAATSRPAPRPARKAASKRPAKAAGRPRRGSAKSGRITRRRGTR
jgi:DNA transformation protein